MKSEKVLPFGSKMICAERFAENRPKTEQFRVRFALIKLVNVAEDSALSESLGQR